METSLITEILAGVVTTLLAVLGLVLRQQLVELKKKLESREKGGENELSLGISMLCDKVISDIVAEIRTKFDASRGYVMMFHNGTFFSGKQPAWKLTCTHESAAQGVSYETMNLQGIPASGVLDIILPFWGEKVTGTTRLDHDPEVLDPRKGIYLIEVEKMHDSVSKQHLTAQNINKLVIMPLTDPEDGRVIGLFGLDFCEEDMPLPNDLEKFRGASNRIAYKITNDNKECYKITNDNKEC